MKFSAKKNQTKVLIMADLIYPKDQNPVNPIMIFMIFKNNKL